MASEERNPEEKDVSGDLRGLISSLRGGAGEPPAPAGRPSPAVPGEAADLKAKIDALETALAAQREAAHAAKRELEAQRAVRAEVEAQIKEIMETARREKRERDVAEDRVHAQGRVDALEKRLDEMHRSLLSMFNKALSGRSEGQGEATAGIRPDAYKSLHEDIRAIREETSHFHYFLADELPRWERRLEAVVQSWMRQAGHQPAVPSNEEAGLRARVEELGRRLDSSERAARALSGENKALLRRLTAKERELAELAATVRKLLINEGGEPPVGESDK